MAKLADIIKYEGDNSTFIWKHPCEDFSSLTQLIVHESQEAVFFMNGQALDLFGPGRYTLESENVPVLGKFLNRVTGGVSPFHCEVYFINKTVQMALKWGTSSRVRYLDPEYGVPLDIGASGELNLQVSDSRKLLIKLVGTMKGIAWENSDVNNTMNAHKVSRLEFTKSLHNSFRPLISTAVKTNLSNAIKSRQLDILEVDSHLEELSSVLKNRIQPEFEEYGLSIPQFYLTTVDLPPENDKNFARIKELHTIALQKRVAQAQAEVNIAVAQAEAETKVAQRQAILEEETTITERSKKVAEREVIASQAKAQKTRLEGFADAEVMRAKGYTKKDELQAEVQKEYAKGIGNMGSNGSAGGSAMSDIVGLGIGLQAAGAMGGQIGNMFKGFSDNDSNGQSNQEKIPCPKCGHMLPQNAKFCLECGEKIETTQAIVCPQCKRTVAKGKFCPECGYKFVTTCPKCGADTKGGKFCLECGEKL